MALQFILGNAGSGKSSYLYDHIVAEAKAHKDQTYLVLVPEQFTMSTQREFVARTKNHCIMNIDVLSFERLAYRVFDELGISDLTVLEDIGKTLVIRKVAIQKAKELTILKKNIGKPGYLDQVKSLLTEFAQYHVTVPKLEEIMEKMPEGLLYYKLKDLKLLYEGMEDYLEGSYITAEKLLILLSEVAHRSKMLKDAVVAFDGYTGFTPVQTLFLKTMFPLVKDVYVTIQLDPREEYMLPSKNHELFHLSKKYVQSLVKLAKETGTEFNPQDVVILKEPEKCRFKGHEGLAHLEKSLFRPCYTRYTEKQQDVRIHHFANPERELRYVAAKITQYVNAGFRYQDMAVVTADLDTYSDLMKEIFDNASIPYFVDEKKKIAFNCFTEVIKGILELSDTDYSYEGVFRFLKSGLTPLTKDEIETLENYVLAAKVRGYKKYCLPFSMLPYGYTEEHIDRVNEIRRKLMELLEPWQEGLKAEKYTVKSLTVSLYQCIYAMGMEEKISDLSKQLEESGRKQAAKEYLQIYRLVMELMDKFVALLGEDEIRLSEYRELLEAGLDATKVASIPPARDCIILGDIERTRLEHIKVLFFVGVNEGVIPRISTGSMCLSQSEREKLEELHMELAASPKERIFVQQFYLYRIMTKADTTLYLSYADHGQMGELMNPSYLIDTVKGIFPALEVENGEDVSFEDLNGKEKQAFLSLIEAIGNYRNDGVILQDMQELIAYFSKKKEYKDELDAVLEGYGYQLESEQLNKSLVKELYGETIKGSVTRLETFAGCNMMHFMRYGLKLKNRLTGEFTMIDMGTVFHGALEKYGKRIKQEGYTYASIPAGLREQYSEEAVRDTIADLNQVFLYENARSVYQIERLIRIVKRANWAMAKQMENSRFEPANFEQSFYLTKKEEEKMLSFEGIDMELSGKIDRIDINREEGKCYYRVIDYKSGNTELKPEEIYDGRQLQLFTYENAAKMLLTKAFPADEVILDGAFYYHIKDKMVETKRDSTPEEIEQLLYDQLRLSGAGAEEDDESVSKKSKEFTREEIELMSRFTKHKIHELGNELVSGAVYHNPLKKGDIINCEYCEFKSICGFDERIPSCTYREGTSGKKEDIFEAMRRREET